MKWNRDKMKHDEEDAKRGGTGYTSMKDGESRVGRFLPVEKPESPDSEAELYIRYGQHWVQALNTYFTCLREPVVKGYVEDDCPFCSRGEELAKSKDEEDQDAARDFKPSIKFLCNFKEKTRDKPSVYRFSTKCLPKVVNLLFDNEDYGDTKDLKDGRDVRISRTGSSRDTEYTYQPVPKTYTIPESILDDLVDLYAEIELYPAKVLRSVVKGGAPDESEKYTLRSVMGGGKKGGGSKKERFADEDDDAPKGKGVDFAKARKGKRQDEDDEDAPLSKADRKAVQQFLDEIGVEGLDLEDTPRSAVHAKMVTEAEGMVVSRLSDELRAWLEGEGCDMSGKKVGPPTKKGKKQDDDGDDDEGDDLTPKEKKMFSGFLDELDVEDKPDFDEHSKDDIVAAIVEAAIDTRVKSLSKEFAAWLEEQGCDVDGKVVGAPSKKGGKKKQDDDEDEDDEPKGGAERDRVSKELAALREGRDRAKGGKK